MYSLVIAEDERMTRRSLVDMIRWNELGFTVDGEFTDGQELLDYLKSSMPDVILTDIKMSRVSGVDIARFVAEQNLPVQIVFLSGYKDFEYAQSAVEYRVVRYLVKPVSLPKLREVFAGLKESLDRQNALQNAMLKRAEHYRKLVNYQRQSFLSDLWSGLETDTEKLEKQCRLLDIYQEAAGMGDCLFLVRLEIQKDSQYRAFLSEYGLSELQEQIASLLGSFDERLEYYPVKWEEDSAKQVLSALGILWQKEHLNALGESGQAASGEIQKNIQEEVYRFMSVRAELFILQKMNSPRELISYAQNPDGPETKQEMAQAQNGTAIETVMQFIRAHFCQDITLSDIAEAVFLNPIYISRLIKEQTGQNYTELLTGLRIGKAVELLERTNLYVYEIAEQVGYHNLKYFYKVFKKATGNSPNDYRPKEK
nr:response regulator [uncultured Acetatifactor sp.]